MPLAARSRALLAATLGLASLAPACAPTAVISRAPAWRQVNLAEHPAPSSRPTGLAFDSDASPAWALPEFARRDADLAISNPRPQLASDQWPEPERADVTRPRYVYLFSQERTYIFFVPPRRAR